MKFGGTMCANKNCALKTNCRRSEASGTTANGVYQSYAFFSPDENNYCEYQIKTNG